MTTPTLAQFEEAAAALRDVVKHTPLDESQGLTDLLGSPVYLKLENLQRTGSFKLRGAAYRLSRLSAEERSRGVVMRRDLTPQRRAALPKLLGFPCRGMNPFHFYTSVALASVGAPAAEGRPLRGCGRPGDGPATAEVGAWS